LIGGNGEPASNPQIEPTSKSNRSYFDVDRDKLCRKTLPGWRGELRGSWVSANTRMPFRCRFWPKNVRYAGTRAPSGASRMPEVAVSGNASFSRG
jgi:hypothetical protein